MHLPCPSADPHAAVSSAACRAWQYACTINIPLPLQAEGVQSGGPHKGAGLMGHVYNRKLEQAQQVRTQPIEVVCASLSASADCLPGSYLQGLCIRCLSDFHASGCCHASFFATFGRSNSRVICTAGFQDRLAMLCDISHCLGRFCCLYTSICIFPILGRCVCCNFASLLQSLHCLELPACCLVWPCVEAVFDNRGNSQQTQHRVLPVHSCSLRIIFELSQCEIVAT